MAILTSKDRKKLTAAAKKKKNTDTGRTAAEKQRKKSVAENTAAGKKKNKSSASKKKTTSSSVLNDTEKKEVEEIRRRTQSLRDRNTAVSQRDAYDAARRKSYGERESVKESRSKLPSLFDESKSKRGSLSLEEQKKNVQGIQRNAEEVKDRNYWLFNKGANKPVEKKSNVPLQTQMTTEEIARRKSVEANQPLGFRNEWQAIAAAYAADVPRDLIGIYDKAVNIPTADYYLNDKYRRYMNGGVKAPVYMGINPQKTAEAEARAKREGYNSLEEWQIAKANEAMSKTDKYYNQKRELYDTADKYIESGRFDPWVKPAMEVAGQIGALTPTIATAGTGGGIAKLIGLGGKAAWAFQNLLMGAEISGSVSGMEAKEMYNAVLNQKQNMIAFMGEDAYKAKTGNEGLTIDDYRDALKRANNTGELVGMAEAATEMLFGGIPLMGKGIVNKIGGKIGFELLSEPTKQQIRTFRNTIGGRIAKQVTERLGGTLGEGTEEAIMAVAQPYIETNVAGVESDVSVEDIIHDFGMGAAVSMILGLPVNAVNDTVIAYDAVQQRRQNKEFIKAAEERAAEMVKDGQMTEEEAAESVREVRDILSGKGSLRVAEEAAYEEKTEADTRRIYDSAEEAQKSLENEFKGKEIGDEVKGAYFDGDEVREFTAAKTEEGVKYRTTDQTEGDIENYRAKAEKIKSAKNETERSGYQLNVKEDIIREVSALSKALGRTIVFDDVAKTYNEDGSANVTRGWFDEKDGSIHVNIHNETPAATVVAHEITHSLEGTKAYAAMQKAVFDYYRSSLGAERKERGALYIEGGKTLESEKDVDYEVMANFVETKLLTDKETINYIVKRNKTFGEKIVNGINRMIQRKIGSKEQKFLAGIRTKWEAALDESRKEGDKKGPSEDGKVAYAFGGEKAKTANLKKLGMAKNMLISGKSAEEIFRETGWFVGADGKWRFEIDDSGMVYHNQSKKGNPDQERQKELYNKMFAGDITQEEWKELSLLEKNGVRRQHQLEDYIDHTALFEAYPELRKVDLVFSSEDTDTAGKYNRGKNRIVLNDRYKKAAEEVLLHEIQHAIQQIEGFSGGTSREAWAVKDLGGDITKRYAEEYADLLKSLPKEDSNKYLRYRDIEFAMDRLLESEKEEDMARYAKYEEESDALYEEMYAEPWFLRLDKLYHLTNDGNALYSYLYTNSAGEIEARDVSSRRKLSAEERRQKMPDIGNEDTVFAEDELADSAEKGNRKFSFGKERDREYMAAVERGDMKTAQRMVNQAAKAAGYDSQKLYHGTPDRRKRDNTGEIVPNEDWNIFDPNKSNADRIDGSALFFTDNKAIAEFYAPRKDNKNSKVFEVYLKKGKMLTVEGNGADWNRIKIPSELPKRKYRGMKVMEYSDTADTSYICKEAKKAGYDSVYFKNIVDGIANNKDMFGDVYAVFDSSQVKSADAVTYDDAGNVIPLSARFDTGNADIRYSYAKEKRGSGEYTYAIGMPVDLEGEKGYISGFRTLESGAVVYTVETFNGIYEDVLQEQIKPRGYEYEAKKESEYRKKKYEEDAKDTEFIPRQTPEQREEARNYFVGDIVEINGERGTVMGRQLLKKGDIVYTVELDNGGTVDVSPDELTVGVTTDFFLEELTEEEQRSWDEAPDEWYMGIDLSEELENAVTLREFSDELYDIGMTISPRKLAQWFKQRKYFKPHRRDNRPSADSLANGYFIVDGKQIYITEKGRNHFSEMFAGKEVKLSKREKQEGVDLPGNERNKEGNPLEESLVKEMLNDYEDEIGTTNEDYWWARLLTGRGVTYSKDYARNFDAAASFNPNVRKHLQRIFVRPLEKAKADYTKAVRNQLNDFHAKMKELGIRKKSDEAAAVQWIGEGQYQDKYGEIHEYTEEMLKKEFPDTWEKIKEAADYCREIYDQYLTDINKAREKIYPHPVEDAEERKAGYEAKKKLCEERIKEQQAVIQGIEQTIEAKKNELPKKKDGSQAKADVLNSIRYNEDRLVRAKDKLKEYIDRKNNYESLVKKIDADIESGDVLVNKRIVARKDYFHHFQELTMNLGDVFSLSRNTTEIDPKMEGTSEYTQPKSKFSGITVHRRKGRYTADAVEGMIRYVQTGEYMIHIDPTIAEFRNHIKGIAEATKDSRNCNKLIRWLVQWTNDLAGKTNTVDRAIQDRINRNFMKAVKWLNSRAKANAVVGNLNSAAVQFFNIPNAAGYVHNPKYWIGGIKDFVKFVGRKQDVRSLLKQSAFVEERYLDDVINKFDERVIDKPGKLARWTLIVGDRYGTAYIWFTAYRQALGRNEKNPIEYADDITRRCVAGRGIGEIPLTQKSVITQVVAPFQIEVNNAWQIYKERLGGVVHERTKKGKAAAAMGFGTILITNFIFNSVTDLLLHRRVLYDPIYAFFSTLQSWMDDDDEDKDIGDLFSQLMGRQAGEVLSNMPYGSIIAYYAVNNDNLRKKFFGESDPTRFGVGNIALDTITDLVQSAVNGENIADDLLAIATTFGTPYGGKELERIIEGLINMGYLPEIKIGRKDGFSAKRLPPGVYNKNGQLQYPVETFSTDWRQALTGMFFGKYATDAGQKYLGKDYEGNSWLRNILGMNQTEPKKPLSERATEVYKNLVAEGGDAFEIYDTIREIQGAENSIDKRNILLNSELTEKEKLSILTGVITAKNNVESETEKINAVLGLGLNIDDYLTIRNMHATINKDESYEKAADRAWAFNNELIAAGYTTDQIKGINETLKFYSHISADTSKFDKLSTSGLDSETSMKVIEALSALEPLEDETKVSSLQKVEAIAGLNLSAEDEKAAMSLALDKKQYAKYRAVTDYGVSAQVWADFEKALAATDANNANEQKRNGRYDMEEKKSALDSMNISNDTKAALWQIKDSELGSSDKDTAWKAARNPYSSSVGAAVVDAYLSNDQSLTETGAVEEGFGAPLPTGVGRKSSEFGYRTHPISGKWKMHWGVDIAAPAGTPVLSVSSGTVKSVGYNGGYGNQVVIQLEDGSQFSYSHLKSYGVKKGDVITKGQQIGEVGSTGTSSTGNHLHLEAIDANGTKVDPETVVDIFGEGIKTSSEYTAVGGGGASSGGSSGGSRSGGGSGSSGGRSSGRSASGGRRTTGTSTASTGSRRSSAGSGSSGGSSGGVTLPTASQASAITGRSTKATTYSQGGVTLPTARELAGGRAGTISSTASAKSTQRTGRSKGSFWNENILG